LLGEIGIRNAGNNKDRIYGFLWLQKDENDVRIEVEYGKSTEDVYYDFALAHLRNNQIGILYDAGKPKVASEAFDKAMLPSWVPDLRQKRNDHFGPYKTAYFASAKEVPASIVVEDTILPLIGIRGTLIDVVTFDIPTLLPDIGTTEISMQHVWQFLPSGVFSFYDFYSKDCKGRSYPTGEDAGIASARTMVIDNRGYRCQTYLGIKTSHRCLYVCWLELAAR
jgi:hypothetical protein